MDKLCVLNKNEIALRVFFDVVAVYTWNLSTGIRVVRIALLFRDTELHGFTYIANRVAAKMLSSRIILIAIHS